MASRDNVMNNIDNRIIYFSDEVDNETIGSISFKLLYIISEDDKKEKKERDFKREPIHIYINSRGGCLYDMWGLIDIMLQSKTPIYTYCTGYAMSAAFKIFLAGEKRFIGKHATLLYHQLSSWESGTYQHFVEHQVELDRQQGMIEQYVQDRTHITESTLQAIREKKQNWFINYEEAMHLGVATDIVG